MPLAQNSMELSMVILGCVIMAQWVFIFYMYNMFLHERKQLIDRIMAKSFVEYTSSEMAKVEAEKPDREIVTPKIRI
jgi:hypothetical protein